MPMTATVTGLSSSPWPGSNACQQMSGLAATFATQPRSGPSFPWVARSIRYDGPGGMARRETGTA